MLHTPSLHSFPTRRSSDLKLKAGKIDLVITDVLMRGMDGYRFCHEVRQNDQFRNLPIIIYTATYTSANDEKLSRDLGARSEEHTSELQSLTNLVCRLLLEK